MEVKNEELFSMSQGAFVQPYSDSTEHCRRIDESWPYLDKLLRFFEKKSSVDSALRVSSS